MGIRTFIAVDTSDEVKKKFEQLSERLQKGASFFPVRPSWVKSENCHITLKFLGSIEESLIEQIVNRMQAVASRARAITLSAKGMGVFPNRRQPRILWIGIKRGSEELIRLQEHLEKQLVPLGFETERRPFHPHLTLARFKTLKGTAALMQVVTDHQPLSDLGEWPAAEMILFKSELHPQGAIYTPLEIVKLSD